MLSFPPLTFLLYVVSPWALYFTGWYDASLRVAYVHELMHVHLVRGRRPVLLADRRASTRCPGRVAYPFRVLLTVLTLPFHAFLGRHDHGSDAR